MKLWGPAALAAMLTIAACGGTASSASQARDHSTTSTTSPTTTTSPTAADRQIERTAALRLTDLPDGWRVQGDTHDPEDDASDRELARCMGLPESFLVGGSNDDRRSYAGPNGEVVSGAAMLAASRPELTPVFDALQQARVPGCMQDLMQQSFDRESATDPEGGIHLGPVTASRLDVGRLGERSVGFRVEFPLRFDGVTIPPTVVHADFVLVQRGRAAILVTALGEDAPVPEAFTAGLVRKVSGRLPATVTS